MKSLYKDYTEARTHSNVLTYTGSLNGEMIASLLQLLDSKLRQEQVARRPHKNIINILIECLQNIFYHTEKDKSGKKDGKECIFIFGRNEDHYFIKAGNYILNDQVEALKARLDKIKPMNPSELHSYYLEVLDKGELSAKGGAGLGMIRIFRESNQSVSYDFTKVDDQFSYFSMEVTVNHDK